jgi:hypothetical protein
MKDMPMHLTQKDCSGSIELEDMLVFGMGKTTTTLGLMTIAITQWLGLTESLELNMTFRRSHSV